MTYESMVGGELTFVSASHGVRATSKVVANGEFNQC